MIIICSTIVLIIAIISIAICFIEREKAYAAKDFSEQQLLHDIRIRSTGIFNKYIDKHDKCIEEDSAFYGDMHPLYDAIYDIVVMTSDYEHDYDSDKDLQS